MTTSRMAVRRPPAAMPSARLVAALVLVALAPVSVLAGRVALASDLPARLPVRWDGRGAIQLVPDSNVLTWAVGAGLIGLAVATFAAVLLPQGFFVQRVVVCTGGFVSAAGAAVWWLLVSLVLNAPVPEDPSTSPRPTYELVWALGGLAVMLVVLARVCGPRPGRTLGTRPPAADLPRVELPLDGPRVWERDLFAGFFLLPACAIGITGAVMFVVSQAVSVVCWVVTLLSFFVLRMRLRIDDDGLSMSPWVLRRGMRIPFAEIGEASAELDTNPWSLGVGRSKVLPSESGFVLRKGPALVLHMADGRRLAVMMSHPEVPAGIVNAHLDRIRASAVDAR